MDRSPDEVRSACDREASEMEMALANSMIKRVARLLCEQRGGDPDAIVQGGDATGHPVGQAAWKLHTHDARAVLIAVREPTDRMKFIPGALPDENRYAWERMVDAALAEDDL